MKFQQFTSPVAAKGVEDTAHYRFNRLAALDEVGGDPDNRRPVDYARRRALLTYGAPAG